MKRIGLTGGIATGKSTVAQRWARQPGTVLIDSDLLAHEAYRPGTATYQAVREMFGDEILLTDGTLNRRRLGEIVFADDQKRLALNHVVHPAVREMWTAQMETLAQTGQTQTVVVAIPLLFEVGAQDQFDWVVAVGCSEATQLARLLAKGMTEAHARARMRAQWPLQTKLDRADFVIWNDGELALLDEQADLVWKQMQE